MQTTYVQDKKKNGQRPTFKKLVDQTEIQITACYLVQKLRTPTLHEILVTARERMSCDINEKKLGRALDGLKKADITAQNTCTLENGIKAIQHSMKRFGNWQSSPEYAHIADLLPQLLATKEAQEIIDTLNGQEGKGTSKKMRGNDIDDYQMFEMLIMFTDPLLGGGMDCPAFDVVRKEHGINQIKPGEDPNLHPTMEGKFYVDPLTGRYVLTSDQLGGWFRENAIRYAGVSSKRAEYVEFLPVELRPLRPVVQMQLPVQTQGKPGPPKTYECVLPGHFAWLRFTAPTKGLLTPEQLEKTMIMTLMRPRRGLSPARGRKYGRALPVSFRHLGAIKDKFDIERMFDGLPEELRQSLGLPIEKLPTELTDEHRQYVADAFKRLKDVELPGINGNGPALGDEVDGE